MMGSTHRWVMNARHEPLLLENFDALRRLCPAGRAGTPEDVAAIVGFLSSDSASYISGQLIAVDGGTS